MEINISNDNRSIKIKIDNIDKIRRKELPYIDKNIYQFQQIKKNQEINDYNNNHFTEVVVYLPKISVDYSEINKLLKKYAVLNTHIDFNIQITLSKRTKILSCYAKT